MKSASAEVRSLKERLSFVGAVFLKSVARYEEVEGLRLGAAFSFYATFAIFPLLLLATTVVGFVVGSDASVRDRIVADLGSTDASVRNVIDQALTTMQASQGARKTSAVIGLMSLLFSASGAFVELDFALNKIWRVPPRAGKGVIGMIHVLVRERLVGFACVAGIGVFMLASLVLSTVAERATTTVAPALLQMAELGVSLTLLSAVFTAAFHFVPRSRPPLRDVVGGAVLTAALLTVLKGLFALYLSHLTSYSAYGVVGGVLALATWIYLSSQIIFFGATVTRVRRELERGSATPARAPAPDVHPTTA